MRRLIVAVIFSADLMALANRADAGRLVGDTAACLNGNVSLTPQRSVRINGSRLRPLLFAFTEPDQDSDQIQVSVDSFTVNTPCQANFATPVPTVGTATDSNAAATTVYVAGARCQTDPMIYDFAVTCSSDDGSQTVSLTFTK